MPNKLIASDDDVDSAISADFVFNSVGSATVYKPDVNKTGVERAAEGSGIKVGKKLWQKEVTRRKLAGTSTDKRAAKAWVRRNPFKDSKELAALFRMNTSLDPDDPENWEAAAKFEKEHSPPSSAPSSALDTDRLEERAEAQRARYAELKAGLRGALPILRRRKPWKKCKRKCPKSDDHQLERLEIKAQDESLKCFRIRCKHCDHTDLIYEAKKVKKVKGDLVAGVARKDVYSKIDDGLDHADDDSHDPSLAPPQQLEDKKRYRSGPSSADVKERDRCRADLFRTTVNNPPVSKETVRLWRAAGSARFRQVEADRKRAEAISDAHQLIREQQLTPAAEAIALSAVLDANPPKRKGRQVRTSQCPSRKDIDELKKRAEVEREERDLVFVEAALNKVGLGTLFDVLTSPPRTELKMGRPPKRDMVMKKSVANLLPCKILPAKEKLEKYPPKTEVRVVSREERIRRAQRPTGWSCDAPKIRRHIPTCTPIAPPGAWARAEKEGYEKYLAGLENRLFCAPSLISRQPSSARP